MNGAFVVGCQDLWKLTYSLRILERRVIDYGAADLTPTTYPCAAKIAVAIKDDKRLWRQVSKMGRAFHASKTVDGAKTSRKMKSGD